MTADGNIARSLARRIAKKVHAKQVGLFRSLKVKHVVRNGVTYLVVKVGKDSVTVSDLKTDVKQTNTFRLKSFLSRKVSPVEPSKAKEE